jgi:hypothetical protein
MVIFFITIDLGWETKKKCGFKDGDVHNWRTRGK